MNSIFRARHSGVDEKKPFSLDDVTAIICSKDAEIIIGDCISAALGSGVGRVLVVDGNSQDQTRVIATSLGVEVFFDQGKGLGAARNLGAKQSSSGLALFLGPDNLISKETIAEMVAAINQPGVVATSCLTVQRKKDYWSRAADLFRSSVVRPGDAQILPTPTLYLSSLLALEPYSEVRRFSDDSELFERWNRVFGGRNVVVDKAVIEIGNDALGSHLKRFSYYGISDYENFVAGKLSGWPLRRQVKSVFHPLRRQFIDVFPEAGFAQFTFFSPALLLFTFVRYLGWARVASRMKLKTPDPQSK